MWSCPSCLAISTSSILCGKQLSNPGEIHLCDDSWWSFLIIFILKLQPHDSSEIMTQRCSPSKNYIFKNLSKKYFNSHVLDIWIVFILHFSSRLQTNFHSFLLTNAAIIRWQTLMCLCVVCVLHTNMHLYCAFSQAIPAYPWSIPIFYLSVATWQEVSPSRSNIFLTKWRIY